MSAYTYGFVTDENTVCVKEDELTVDDTERGPCNPPSGALYVCTHDVLDYGNYIDAVNFDPTTWSPFLTATEYINMQINLPNDAYVLKFCEQIPLDLNFADKREDYTID